MKPYKRVLQEPDETPDETPEPYEVQPDPDRDTRIGFVNKLITKKDKDND